MFGRFAYSLGKNSNKEVSQVTQKEDKQGSVLMEYAKVYKNEKYGFEIQYPYFFNLKLSSDCSEVSFINNTCETEDRLCFRGTDGIDIMIGEELGTIDDYYEKMKGYFSSSDIKKIRIMPLPYTSNENEWIMAVRQEYPHVLKQALGGYTYVIIENGKIFTISTATTSSTGDNKSNPLLDEMMETFRFIK